MRAANYASAVRPAPTPRVSNRKRAPRLADWIRPALLAGSLRAARAGVCAA